MSALGKIQSKHVDFVICDQNLYIKAIVELDDKSHDQPDRQERDRFVDDVLTSVGYTVIRTRAVAEETLTPLVPHVEETVTACSGEHFRCS
jgi:very-short-patch-repair endonuclease